MRGPTIELFNNSMATTSNINWKMFLKFMLFKNAQRKKLSDLINSLENIVQENKSYLPIIGVFILF